jgi:hypothetical protein
LFGSKAVLVHAPPHWVCPARHRVRQALRAQTWVGEHGIPQPPQLFGSLRVVTHVPLQSTWPTGQTQWLATQTVPPAQTWPQAPQSLGLFTRLTHAPLQSVSPPPHVAAHWPLVQTWFAKHAAPHAPQFIGSDPIATQMPPHGTSPRGQTHAPPLQNAPPPQTVPHVPQWVGSLRVSTHAPPQSVSPLLQANVH